MIKRVTGEQWLAIGIILLGLVMAWQMGDIPDDAGYAGIGPRFFPSLVIVGLIVAILAYSIVTFVIGKAN